MGGLLVSKGLLEYGFKFDFFLLVSTVKPLKLMIKREKMEKMYSHLKSEVVKVGKVFILYSVLGAPCDSLRKFCADYRYSGTVKIRRK